MKHIGSKIGCRDIHREIEEAGVGESLSTMAGDHVKSCTACSTFYDEQLKLRQIVASLGTVSAPNDFDFRLRARLAGEKRSAANPLAVSWSFGFRSAAFATLVAALGVAILFAGLRRDTSPIVADDSRNAATVGNGKSAKADPTSGESQATGAGQQQVAVVPTNALGDPGATSPSRKSGGKRGMTSRRTAAAELASRRSPRGTSEDMASTQAPILRAGSEVASTQGFPIHSSPQPLKVSLDNGRGSSKTISLPGVSFGAQPVLAQSSPVLASARGAW